MLSDDALRSACCDVLDRYATETGGQKICSMLINERYEICDLVLTGRARLLELSGMELAYLARRLSYYCAESEGRVPFAISLTDSGKWWMSEGASAAVAIEVNEDSGYFRLGWLEVPNIGRAARSSSSCWQIEAVAAHWGIEGVALPQSVLSRLAPDQVGLLRRLNAAPRVPALLRCLQEIPVPGRALGAIGPEDATRRARDLKDDDAFALLSWGSARDHDLCNRVCDSLGLAYVGHAEYMAVRRECLRELDDELGRLALNAFTNQ